MAFKCAYYGWSYGEALWRSPVLWTSNRRGLLLWHVLRGKVCVHYLMYYFSVLKYCKARSFQSFPVPQTTCTYIKDWSWNLPIILIQSYMYQLMNSRMNLFDIRNCVKLCSLVVRLHQVFCFQFDIFHSISTHCWLKDNFQKCFN